MVPAYSKKKKINSFRVICYITKRVRINIQNLSSLLERFPRAIMNAPILTSKYILKVINHYLRVKIKSYTLFITLEFYYCLIKKAGA